MAALKVWSCMLGSAPGSPSFIGTRAFSRFSFGMFIRPALPHCGSSPESACSPPGLPGATRCTADLRLPAPPGDVAPSAAPGHRGVPSLPKLARRSPDVAGLDEERSPVAADSPEPGDVTVAARSSCAARGFSAGRESAVSGLSSASRAAEAGLVRACARAGGEAAAEAVGAPCSGGLPAALLGVLWLCPLTDASYRSRDTVTCVAPGEAAPPTFAAASPSSTDRAPAVCMSTGVSWLGFGDGRFGWKVTGVGSAEAARLVPLVAPLCELPPEPPGGMAACGANGCCSGMGVGAASGSGVERRLRRARPVRRALMRSALDFLYAERTRRSIELRGSAHHHERH